MSNWQIVFVCILSLLVIAFIIVIILRYKNAVLNFAQKKQVKLMTEILCKDKTDEEKWVEIKHSFVKNDSPNYAKIHVILRKIYNSSETDKSVLDIVNRILEEKEFYFSMPSVYLAESIDALWKEIDKSSDTGLRDANMQLIRDVKIYCEATNENKKLDKIINILFELMEIASFILAILSVR